MLTVFNAFQSSRKSGNVRPPKVWAEEEELQLRELYEEFKIANGECVHFSCHILEYLIDHLHTQAFLAAWSIFCPSFSLLFQSSVSTPYFLYPLLYIFADLATFPCSPQWQLISHLYVWYSQRHPLVICSYHVFIIPSVLIVVF